MLCFYFVKRAQGHSGQWKQCQVITTYTNIFALLSLFCYKSICVQTKQGDRLTWSCAVVPLLATRGRAGTVMVLEIQVIPLATRGCEPAPNAPRLARGRPGKPAHRGDAVVGTQTQRQSKVVRGRLRRPAHSHHLIPASPSLYILFYSIPMFIPIMLYYYIISYLISCIVFNCYLSTVAESILYLMCCRYCSPSIPRLHSLFVSYCCFVCFVCVSNVVSGNRQNKFL